MELRFFFLLQQTGENADGNAARVGVVVLVWSLVNEESDSAPGSEPNIKKSGLLI